MSISYLRSSGYDKVMNWCCSSHNESIFRDVPFSEGKFGELFQEVIRSPKHHLGLKARLDDQVLGVLACNHGGYFVGDNKQAASVTTMNTDKKESSDVLEGKMHNDSGN